MNRASFLSTFKKPKIFFTLDEKYDKAKEDLYGWLTSMFCSRGDIDWKSYTYGEIDDNKMGSGGAREKRCRVAIFMGDHRYVFSMTIRKDGKNYLGGTMTTTRYEVGENWTRGSDLPDGDFSKETFDSIIKSILACEFKRIKTQSGRIEDANEPRGRMERLQPIAPALRLEIEEAVDPHVPAAMQVNDLPRTF